MKTEPGRTTIDHEADELSHRFPQFLPDGEHLIYLVRRKDDRESDTVLATLEEPQPGRVLVRTPVKSIVAGTRLLYFRHGALLSQGLDPSAGLMLGDR